jgi:t-SNARE complex subunit (syntaxin)
MNYYLPNGKKWTVDSGDWESYHLHQRRKKRKNRIYIFSVVALFFIVIGFLLFT